MRCRRKARAGVKLLEILDPRACSLRDSRKRLHDIAQCIMRLDTLTASRLFR
jgi:hypothetical protein